jgi:hypothetical protein
MNHRHERAARASIARCSMLDARYKLLVAAPTIYSPEIRIMQ